jgi:hypothetical protein
MQIFTSRVYTIHKSPAATLTGTISTNWTRLYLFVSMQFSNHICMKLQIQLFIFVHARCAHGARIYVLLCAQILFHLALQ